MRLCLRGRASLDRVVAAGELFLFLGDFTDRTAVEFAGRL